MIHWYEWVAYVGGVVLLLLLDLLVFHRDPHRISAREATVWSIIWIGLGLLFAPYIGWRLGPAAAGDYLAGYLVEKSLSVDNLFVFLLLFRFFAVSREFQHRVLFYGILGALLLRGIFIAAGAAILNHFSWVAYLFGLFLVWTAWRLVGQDEIEVHPDDNPVLRLFRRLVPSTDGYRGQRFLVHEGGRWLATPMLAVLVCVETTDVLFAVDSIPAIFGITRDPFVVFTSNAAALLGLRALFFLVVDLIDRFRYLDKGLAAVLALIGVKMIWEESVHQFEIGNLPWLPEALVFHLPQWVPLVAVAAILATTIVLSLVATRREN